MMSSIMKIENDVISDIENLVDWNSMDEEC